MVSECGRDSGRRVPGARESAANRAELCLAQGHGLLPALSQPPAQRRVNTEQGQQGSADSRCSTLSATLVLLAMARFNFTISRLFLIWIICTSSLPTLYRRRGIHGWHCSSQLDHQRAGPYQLLLRPPWLRVEERGY